MNLAKALREAEREFNAASTRHRIGERRSQETPV
jgi:hypothetical protein